MGPCQSVADPNPCPVCGRSVAPAGATINLIYHPGMPRSALRKVGPDELGAFSDDQLLDLQFRELDIKIEGTELANRIDQLFTELGARNLAFRPHFWLSDEWFSPDGIPGIAIPFYLAHPRLAQLELPRCSRSRAATTSGACASCGTRPGTRSTTPTGCACGAAARALRQLVGALSRVYPPRAVQPELRAASRSLVRAEPSGRGLRRDVRGVAAAGLALARAIRGLAGAEEARVRRRADAGDAAGARSVVERDESIRCARLRKTLRQHYRRKRAALRPRRPTFYDRDLRRLFADAPEHAGNMTAALPRPDPAAVGARRRAGRIYQYTIDQVLEDMIDRAASWTCGWRCRKSRRACEFTSCSPCRP